MNSIHGESSSALPSSLLDLLSNALVLSGILPYLTLSSIFALSKTSKSFQSLLLKSSDTFRYLDLSRCRGAYIPPTLTPIDSGGNSWRAERIDENLTEDEFYAGPLRGVMGRLTRMKVLHTVNTLVLDNLASVTHDLISEILTSDTYNIRLLSIRRCINVNQSKLQRLLTYICRPTRPEGSPKLQGLYIFTEPVLQRETNSTHTAAAAAASTSTSGVTMSQGAQLGGALPSSDLLTGTDNWYAPTGRMVKQGSVQRTSWEETILACQGIISFDAVLCTHMHKDMNPVLHEGSREFLSQNDKPGIPTLATITLGPDGCASCGRAPHGAPVWGVSSPREFPLLWPPPFSGKLIDALTPPPPPAPRIQSAPPSLARSPNDHSAPQGQHQRLIVSCTWCLANRHCDSCHRWWCADCYNPKRSRALRDLLETMGQNTSSAGDGAPSPSGNKIKVFNSLCVEYCLFGEWMVGAGGDGMWG